MFTREIIPGLGNTIVSVSCDYCSSGFYEFSDEEIELGYYWKIQLLHEEQDWVSVAYDTRLDRSIKLVTNYKNMCPDCAEEHFGKDYISGVISASKIKKKEKRVRKRER